MPEFQGDTQAVSYFSSLRTLIRTRWIDVTIGLDFEVKGFVKGAKVHSSDPSGWHARVCLRQFFTMQLFVPPQFKVNTTQGCILVVRTEMQYVLYQRKIELRARCMRLAFEC
jgi:hypothetical protein